MKLINNLINTQLINEEIFLNNEIKKESESLVSLLNVKQNTLMNQLNINNNINPFMFPQNLIMQPQPIIPNPMQQNIISNNMENYEINQNLNNINFFNVKFCPITGGIFTIICKPNDKVSEIIKKYREKANDFRENNFLFNDKRLTDNQNSTLFEIGVGDGSVIKVAPIRTLEGRQLKWNS